MVVILAKSVSFNLLVLILRKRYYCIEYLEPINNSIIKILVKLMESNLNSTIESLLERNINEIQSYLVKKDNTLQDWLQKQPTLEDFKLLI